MCEDVRIADVAAGRLIDLNADEPAGPAFPRGVMQYTLDRQGVPTISLAVWVQLHELGRHTDLHDAERNPHEDRDDLGYIQAYVDVFFQASMVRYFCFERTPLRLRSRLAQYRFTQVLQLPRRRIIVDECTFFLGDFTEEQRRMLGIEYVADTRMVTSPSQPLDSQPYNGTERQSVLISLHVAP